MIENEAIVAIADFELYVKTLKQEQTAQGTTIFLHDSLGCTTLWRDFPARYAQLTHHDVIIYDRRGYGRSTPYQDEVRGINYMETEADVLAELLKQLQISQCTLFGHSDGATISLIAAAKYPDLIRQLIIEGPHIYMEEVTHAGVRAASITYNHTDLRQRLEKYHGERTDEMVKAWTSTWLSDFFQEWNIVHQLPSIVCPVIAFQGEKDEFGTAQQVWDIQKHSTGKCEVHLIPKIGHTPHKECPEVVLSHLEEYLSKE